jgi:hypothetical protein
LETTIYHHLAAIDFLAVKERQREQMAELEVEAVFSITLLERTIEAALAIWGTNSSQELHQWRHPDTGAPLLVYTLTRQDNFY